MYVIHIINKIENPYQRSRTGSEMTYNILLKELSIKLSSIWEDIGIHLGLNMDLLDIIKKDNPNDSKSCFKEMIKLWWKQIDPPTSWAAIIEVIENLGHKRLAKDLKLKYL